MMTKRTTSKLAAAVAATALLAACSSDDSGSTTPAGETSANGGAPQTAIADLAVNTEDLEGITVVPVSNETYQQGLEQLTALLDSIQIDPAECRDAYSLQPTAEDTANLEGRQGQIPAEGEAPAAVLSLSVGPHKDDIANRSALTERCPDMTIGVPGPEGNLTSYNLHNADAGVAAPADVEDFTSISQTSSGEAVGPTDANSLMLSGTVRELDVIVALTSSGQISDTQRNQAVDVFNKQVDKIKNAE